jgi:hypothetical protein
MRWTRRTELILVFGVPVLAIIGYFVFYVMGL